MDTGAFPVEELRELLQSLHQKKRYHRLRDGRLLRLDDSMEGQQIAEHLHRLAKAHIIGQNAAHAVAIQCAQPAVAVPLIFAQDLLQGEGRGIFAVLDRMEASADPPERIVAVEADAVLSRQCPVQTRRAIKRQFCMIFSKLCEHLR